MRSSEGRIRTFVAGFRDQCPAVGRLPNELWIRRESNPLGRCKRPLCNRYITNPLVDPWRLELPSTG